MRKETLRITPISDGTLYISCYNFNNLVELCNIISKSTKSIHKKQMDAGWYIFVKSKKHKDAILNL